jgi:hypothetical protein
MESGTTDVSAQRSEIAAINRFHFVSPASGHALAAIFAVPSATWRELTQTEKCIVAGARPCGQTLSQKRRWQLRSARAHVGPSGLRKHPE